LLCSNNIQIDLKNHDFNEIYELYIKLRAFSTFTNNYESPNLQQLQNSKQNRDILNTFYPIIIGSKTLKKITPYGKMLTHC